MGRKGAVICQLAGAIVGAYGVSSIAESGVGWGSVFLGLVLIFLGSTSLFSSRRPSVRTRSREDED